MSKIVDKHKGIARLYASGEYTTTHLAEIYGVTPKTIQRIARKYGVIRTLTEANKLMAPLKHYRKLPPEAYKKRKHLLARVRYQLLKEHPFCTVCGAKERLEIDHIDNDPTNNDLSNLQVLCDLCNAGKSHLDMYPS